MSKITRPNTENTSAAYWEKVLASHGLGVDQPLTDNSDEATSGESVDITSNDFLHLRRSVDKGDRFMEAHQIKKIRRDQDRRQPRSETEWAMDNKRVREVLLLSFPNLYTNDNQRRRAGRWVRVIYLYYRMKQPYQIVAKEIGITTGTLKTLIRNMNRVAQGRRANGSGKRTCHLPSSL